MTSEGARIALEVADWRRRVAAIYAEVRSADDAAIAHERWRVARDRLLAEHPATPLLPAARAGFTRVFNVLEGFEGDLDEEGRRGNLGGWRLAGLPWAQG